MEKEFYIHLSSKDSVKTFTTNTASDFSVLLPNRLQFNPIDTWSCGLVQLIIPTAPSKPAFLCSNFSQSSIVGERQLPVLSRVVDVTSDPSHVIYVSIKCSEIDIIRLYLTGCEGEKFSVSSGIAYCTLHFIQNHEGPSSNR